VEVFKDRALTVFVLGQVVIAQSVIWPYVRVQPGYTIGGQTFTPDALRGFEMGQGMVLLGASLLLALLATLIAMGVIKETVAHTWLVTGAMIAFVAIAALLTDARPTMVGEIGAFLMSALAASIVINPLIRVLGDRIPERMRRSARVTTWIVSFVVITLAVAGPLFAESPRPTWLVLSVVFALIGGYMTVRPPALMGPYRMILVGSTSVLIMAFTMSTSLRVDLQERQEELGGLVAGVTRLQTTYGVFIAWVGALAAFGAAYSLWGHRRDRYESKRRERRVEELAEELDQPTAA
jgi:hypothetical protein